MTKEEMNQFLESIGGLERVWRPDLGPINDASFFNVAEGWYPLIKDLIEELITLGWNKKIVQVKEKFGGLRFYVGTLPEGGYEIISKYEGNSYSICEKCGEEGKIRGSLRWVLTLCDKHFKEKEEEQLKKV